MYVVHPDYSSPLFSLISLLSLSILPQSFPRLRNFVGFVANLVQLGSSVWPLGWNYPLEPGRVTSACQLKTVILPLPESISNKQLSGEMGVPEPFPCPYLAVDGLIFVQSQLRHLWVLWACDRHDVSRLEASISQPFALSYFLSTLSSAAFPEP